MSDRCYPSRRCHLGRPDAFTLIELLVVTAVIAVLAAMLTPALVRGKVSAARIRCVANLHQMGLATQMYWDDNSGNCFRYGGTLTNQGRLYWFGWIGPGSEGEREFDAAGGVLYPYLKGRGVELCPSFNRYLSQFKPKARTSTYGYGYNLYLSAGEQSPAVAHARILRPSGTALFADAAQVNTWQPPASAANPMLEEWYYVDTSTNQPNGHFRHMKSASVIFCDGHVASERMAAGSLDLRLPAQQVGSLRPEVLVLH